MRILVVEDNAEMAEALVEALSDKLYTVDLAQDGDRASELMESRQYDLVILDWSIPGPSGIDLLRAWRAQGRDTPVLMLTAHRDVARRVDGLDAGADDYLVKPFAFAELDARVRSLLRRGVKTLIPKLIADDVEMDRAAQRVTVAGLAIHLSPKEFSLLEYFLRHKDELITRTALAAHVWEDGIEPASNVIDVLIHRLRKKIDQGRPSLLHAVPGKGYILASARGGAAIDSDEG